LRYDPNPVYRLASGEVEVGYAALAADLVRTRPSVLAVDGPAALAWPDFLAGLQRALAATGISSRAVDVRDYLAPWEEVQRRTAASELPGDPVFARLFDGPLETLFDGLPRHPGRCGADLTIIFGPGSALMGHGLLWYVDLPKRFSLAAVQRGDACNLGQPPGLPGSEQRHLFVDWPLLDRHRDRLASRLDRFVDLTRPERPRAVGGEVLRRTLGELAAKPFRARPAFQPGSWGGQWLRRVLGVEPDAPNLAWSYELIAPESGLLLGDGEPVEVPFGLLVAAQAERLMGPEVTERFGRSFPIRFDYLDTVDGGDLSVHCHPLPDVMRDTFGWSYPQHESYYVMVTRPGARIFLGLRGEVDVEQFRLDAGRAEELGLAFDIEKYVQTFPAEQHRLYLIPAGTPHGSGEGNLVLEISSTPYLYSLRFYDWLRRDLDGSLRPVHLDHAFTNVDVGRRGDAVRHLMQQPRVVRSAPGFVEEVLGAAPELFFEVRRLGFEEQATDDTAGRFHVLNLVAGQEAVVETAGGHTHRLAYGETMVVPAAAGRYRLRRLHGPPC
jgi:mannose-6-phosphate isomerase class I